MSRKQSSYKEKFHGGTSYTYTNRKCQHNGTHAETTLGVQYTICNACNTIRSNHGKSKTPRQAVLLKAA
jgi:hypothetical protein